MSNLTAFALFLLCPPSGRSPHYKFLLTASMARNIKGAFPSSAACIADPDEDKTVSERKERAYVLYMSKPQDVS